VKYSIARSSLINRIRNNLLWIWRCPQVLSICAYIIVK